MKKRSYKDQIESGLTLKKWEVTSIVNRSEWWIDEQWTVEYIYNREIFFYLNFMVDPMISLPDVLISEIKATSEQIFTRMDQSEDIAVLCMTKEIFSEKLKTFLDQLEIFKKARGVD